MISSAGKYGGREVGKHEKGKFPLPLRTDQRRGKREGLPPLRKGEFQRFQDSLPRKFVRRPDGLRAEIHPRRDRAVFLRGEQFSHLPPARFPCAGRHLFSEKRGQRDLFAARPFLFLWLHADNSPVSSLLFIIINAQKLSTLCGKIGIFCRIRPLLCRTSRAQSKPRRPGAG